MAFQPCCPCPRCALPARARTPLSERCAQRARHFHWPPTHKAGTAQPRPWEPGPRAQAGTAPVPSRGEGWADTTWVRVPARAVTSLPSGQRTKRPSDRTWVDLLVLPLPPACIPLRLLPTPAALPPLSRSSPQRPLPAPAAPAAALRLQLPPLLARPQHHVEAGYVRPNGGGSAGE